MLELHGSRAHPREPSVALGLWLTCVVELARYRIS